MSAHTSAADIGLLHLSNGTLLTATSRRTNDRADTLAKQAVEAQRVPEHFRQMIRGSHDDIAAIAKWIGKAALAANRQDGLTKLDTTASRK